MTYDVDDIFAIIYMFSLMLLLLCTVCNLRLQNIARERDERKGASNDFISLTSQFLFIDDSSKDERATRLL